MALVGINSALQAVEVLRGVHSNAFSGKFGVQALFHGVGIYHNL
jgi:hypothetical protein